jgi:dipeptidyl aminopeptidase/acylaminoacyl peptidase
VQRRIDFAEFNSGVAFVGLADWITVLEGASAELKANDRLEYGDIDIPDDREFFKRISPLKHVASVKAPAMVLSTSAESASMAGRRVPTIS